MKTELRSRGMYGWRAPFYACTVAAQLYGEAGGCFMLLTLSLQGLPSHGYKETPLLGMHAQAGIRAVNCR